ncbi:MAG: efflux RND transporter periplasmic adaptor subunit [Proteobacteria bacterium]|nr:efflux RND transporter periplasmic adaptor subunit [Pseudomonadota bacterium]
MRKMYVVILAVILLGVAVYLLLPVRQDMNRKISVAAAPHPSSQTPDKRAVETSSGASVPGIEPGGHNDGIITVEVPLEKQQTMGLKTVAAAVKPMKKTLRTVGRVEFDERKLTTVNIKVEGWIEKLYADYTGKYVDKGTPLADIYSPELISLQLEYINLINQQSNTGFRSQRNIEFSWGDRYGTVGRAAFYDPQGLFEVAKQKFALWEIPEEQIKEIERSKKPIKTMTIKSPARGYVFQKPVFKGTRVAPGDKIFDIVDLSTVWVLADIYEYEIPFIKVGQSARITLSYYPGKEFSSRVDFIYPSLSGQTRTAKVRFVLPNPNLLLKPQMFTNVEMELSLGERLSIPETAILDTGTRQVVYVVLGDGIFSPRQIKVGDRANGMVEVLSGLKAGERVASSAVFLIDSEAKLKGVQ